MAADKIESVLVSQRRKLVAYSLFSTRTVDDYGITGEAIEALMALGYQSNEAAQAVAQINPLPDKVDELIRLALKGMMK